MKRSVVAVTFAMTLAAASANAASSTTIARTIAVGAAEESGQVVAEVELTSDGTLEISKHVNHSRVSPTEIEKFSYQLSKTVSDRLIYEVQRLSREDIAVTHSQIVCMMMPIFPSPNLEVVRKYDADTNTFSGNLVTVLTTAGCWASTHIAPKNQYAIDMAKTLLSELQVIALEAIDKR